MVLHTGGIHWVCASNVGCCKANQVKLYGSLYSGILNFTKWHAALLFVEGNEKTEVIIPPAAQQSNGTDCGVLPLYFATALCFQLDTSSLKFNRHAVRTHLWKKPLMKTIWTCLLMRNYQEKTQQRFFTLPSTVITILANNKWQSVHLARIGSIRSASKFLIKCSNNWSQVSVEVQSPRAETKLGNKWINYTNNRDNFRICDQFVQIQVTHISWQILFIAVFSVKAQVAQAL